MSKHDDKREVVSRDPEVVEPDSPEENGPPLRSSLISREMMAMFGVTQGGRSFHPVFDKFESEHVEKFLDQSHEADMERLRISKTSRWFVLAYVMLALVAAGVLIGSLLPEDKDLLTKLFEFAALLAGGLGSGWGLKSYLDRRRR